MSVERDVRGSLKGPLKSASGSLLINDHDKATALMTTFVVCLRLMMVNAQLLIEVLLIMCPSIELISHLTMSSGILRNVIMACPQVLMEYHNTF